MSTHRKGPAPHRYVHFHVRRTQDQRFRALSKAPASARELLLFLLGCPFSVRVPGVIVAGRAQLAERLGWSLEDFDSCFAELVTQGYCEADWDAGVLYFPEELCEEDNAPQSPNTAKAWRGELDNAPQCSLIERVSRDVLALLRAADDRRIRAERGRGQVVAPCWVPAFLRQDAPAPEATEKPRKKASSMPSPMPTPEASPLPSRNPDPSPDPYSYEEQGGDLATREDDTQRPAPRGQVAPQNQQPRLPPLELLEARPGKRTQDARSAPQSSAEGIGYCLDPERCLRAVTEHSGALLKHGHLVPSATPTALGPVRMHSKFRQLWSSALREYFEELYTTEADVLRELAHFGRYLAQRGESENLYDLCNWRAERFTRLMAEAHAWDGKTEIRPSGVRATRRAQDEDSPTKRLACYLPAVSSLPKPEEVGDGTAVLAYLKKLVG